MTNEDPMKTVLVDGHKEPNDTIYFRYEDGQGWYWCGRFVRSATYATYQKCLDSFTISAYSKLPSWVQNR